MNQDGGLHRDISQVRYRQIITKEKIYEKISKGSAELQHSVTVTDVLEREFPICDVAGG